MHGNHETQDRVDTEDLMQVFWVPKMEFGRQS